MLSFASVSAPTSQRRLALAICILVVAVTVIALPERSTRLAAVPSFLAAFGAAVCIGYVLTAFLLFSQFINSRLVPLCALGATYLYAGLIAIPQIGSYPGLTPDNDLFGAGPQTSAWLWILWHGGFALGIIAFVIVERKSPPRLEEATMRRTLIGTIGATVTLVVALTVLTTLFAGRLPRLVINVNYEGVFHYGVGQAVIFAGVVALGGLMATTARAMTVVRLWLVVAATAALADSVLTLMSGSRYSFGWYLARIDSLIVSVTVLVVYLAEVHILYRKMADLAALDGLTGMLNRRSFDDRIDAIHRNAVRNAEPYAVIMIDIDYFKGYNDTYGHLAGDDCLRAVARAIAGSSTRAIDVVARYGGEEFIVALPDTTADGARIVAERVRRSVLDLQLEHRASTAAAVVTISVGVGDLHPDDGTPEQVIARADGALYEAKEDGRNRVTLAASGAALAAAITP
jgi:diguanylate cyclase (GGDEF)-like protein